MAEPDPSAVDALRNRIAELEESQSRQSRIQDRETRMLNMSRRDFVASSPEQLAHRI